MKKKKTETTGTPRPTIWDVARHSGVSTATVSRVLNGQDYVAGETRDRVLSALRELSYTHTRQPVLAAGGQPELVGLTAMSMRLNEYTEIIAGITEALHARNGRPLICPIAWRHNCGMTLLERLMYKSTVGGLILGSTDDEAELRAALQSGFPFVVIDPGAAVDEGIPVVATSDWHGAKTATEHLIALQHRRIAMITHQSNRFHSADRLAGFQSALMAAGLPLLPEAIYDGGEEDEKIAGYRAAHHFLALSEPPTAIIAVNDTIAVGVIQAARERACPVPAMLSVVGFDDFDLARMITPELTTMHQPFGEMGRVGVDMLYRLIEGRPLDAARVELSARLVVRASSAPAPVEKYLASHHKPYPGEQNTNSG